MTWWNQQKGGADLYVDLGTANTLVVSRAKGIVVNEPSVIAYRQSEIGQKTVVAVGNDAKAKIGRTPGNLVASHPLRDGVIADLDVTEAMLRYFITRARGRMQFMKPRIVISLPHGVSDVEKKAARQAGLAAGAREVLLIDEPMAAAVGAGLPVDRPKGNMIIDIGGGTTEVAIISLCGIVHCEAIRIGGHAFDQAIVSHIRRRHNLVIGDQTAERAKIAIGSAFPGETNVTTSIRGVDFVTGLPRSIDVTEAEIHEALTDSLNQILEACRRALERVPPDLVPDIINDGVVLAGGGALIKRLDERLHKELSIPVRVATDPLLTIALGGEQAIRDPALLDKIIISDMAPEPIQSMA